MIRSFSFLLIALASAGAAEWKFPCPENEIARYTAYRVSRADPIDGRLDEPAWQRAPRSPRFADILTGRPVMHDTRAAVLWDDENLYVAYRVEEPFVQAKFTTNNDLDLLGQRRRVLHCRAGRLLRIRDQRLQHHLRSVLHLGRRLSSGPDLRRLPGVRALQACSRSTAWISQTHPRGGRLGNFNWHFPGKKTAVFIDGTVNDDTDRDRGWTVELAFPWDGMTWLARPTVARCRRRKATSGAWISPASTSTRKRRPRKGFRRLVLEPPRRLGLAHSGVLSLHPFHDQ